MKEMRALLRDPDHKELMTADQLTQLDEHLHLFEEGINRWIEIIMGSISTATRQFHVTEWAVIQYFIVVTWNRAFCRGDSSLLISNLDVRWQAWFAPLVDRMGDVMKQPMSVAMKFLGYHCTMPTCRFHGFCATLCGACKNGQPVRGKAPQKRESGRGGYTQDQADKAFLEWKKKDGNSKKKKSSFLAECPQYLMDGGSESARSTSMNPQEAMEYLARHQTVVLEPTGAFGEL
jgi:hypothetical protein